MSLPKTGSATLAQVFSEHRAFHELAFLESVDILLDREDGRIDDDRLDAFLLGRDRAARPEVDSATFLHLAADRIPSLFRDARFVISIRSCEEWMTSFLGMMLEAFGPGGWGVDLPPGWVRRHARNFSPTLAQVDFGSKLAVAMAGPRLADELAAYWGVRVATTLNAAPPERTLVIPTGSIRQATPDLAALAGIPVDALRSGVHVNRGRATATAGALLGADVMRSAAEPWERHVAAARAGHAGPTSLPSSEGLAAPRAAAPQDHPDT